MALAGQPSGDRFSSRPRVSTVTRAHGLACCTPEPVAQGHRRGPQGIQRVSQLARAVLGGQGIRVECYDGLDARCPQLAGRPAGPADPAAHGAARERRGRAR